MIVIQLLSIASTIKSKDALIKPLPTGCTRGKKHAA